MVHAPTEPTSTIPLATTTSTSSSPPPPPKRPTVLVVGHPDGWIEVYADQGLDARFVMLADAPGADGEVAAEDLATMRLPRRHREVYLPGRLQLADQIRRERPSDIARRDTLVGIHRALAGIGGDR